MCNCADCCLGPACLTNDSALPTVNVVPDAVLDDTKRVRSSLRPERSDDEGYAGTVGGARWPGLGLMGEGGAVEVDADTSRTGGAVGAEVGGAGNWANIAREASIDIRLKSSVRSRVQSNEGRDACDGRAVEALRGLDPARCFPREMLDNLLFNASDVLRPCRGMLLGRRREASVCVSPFRERREGTVLSADNTDASVASSLRNCETSVSLEKTRFEPFISFLICSIRLAACCL